MASISLEQRSDHYTVSTAVSAVSPADAYAAWALELGLLADTNAALNEDDQGFPVTLGQPFFDGGSTTAMVSSEAGIGFYSAAPASSASTSYALSGQGVSRFYGLGTRPTLLLTYHPQNDLRSEAARFEQNAQGSIYYSEHRTYNAQTFRCHVAVRVTTGSVTAIIRALDQAVPVKLFELTEQGSLVVRQQLDVVTVQPGETIAVSIGPLQYSLLGEPSIYGNVDIFAYASVPSMLQAPSVRGTFSMPTLPDTGIYYEAEIKHEGQSLLLPISSWQGTQQIDRANYLQIVVPAASGYIDQISQLQSGQFFVYRKSLLPNGDSVRIEMARSTVNEFTYQNGPFRSTATLAGYMPSDYSIGASVGLVEPPELFEQSNWYSDGVAPWSYDVALSNADYTVLTALLDYPQDTGGRTRTFTVSETIEIEVAYFNDFDESLGMATGQVGLSLVSISIGETHWSQFTNAPTDGWQTFQITVPPGDYYWIFNGFVWSNVSYASVTQSIRSVRLPQPQVGGGFLESETVRIVKNVRSLSITNGKRRLRCDIDWFLRPGMEARYGPGDGEVFVASWINYYVGGGQAYMEVGEREL